MVEESAEEEILSTQKPLIIAKSGVSNGKATPTATLHTADDESAPPDGGTRACLILLGSFFCNGILFGVINSYSVLYGEFHKNFERRGSTNPSGDAGE